MKAYGLGIARIGESIIPRLISHAGILFPSRRALARSVSRPPRSSSLYSSCQEISTVSLKKISLSPHPLLAERRRSPSIVKLLTDASQYAYSFLRLCVNKKLRHRRRTHKSLYSATISLLTAIFQCCYFKLLYNCCFP